MTAREMHRRITREGWRAVLRRSAHGLLLYDWNASRMLWKEEAS